MESIVERIRAELKENIDEKTISNSKRFFKEEIIFYGVNTALVGKIAKSYWKQIEHLPKEEIFALCEKLYSSDYMEEAFIVSYWGEKFSPFLQEQDITIFERWIESYINNWAKCDGFCNHALGDYFQLYPHQVTILYQWAQSHNRWMRRASAVSLILPARKGMFLEDVFKICDILLLDKDDLVQKGYGWLLKEESRKHQEEVFNYVTTHKQHMPRTALRYAIELMPEKLRKMAMTKEK
jgi:3-methyladenine DNA glycosylase AlkD